MIDLGQAFARVDYRIEIDEASEDQKRVFLAGLTAICSDRTPALNELRDWLQSTLAEEEFEVPTRGDREVVERKKTDGGCYQLEKIRCGKPNCKCAKGELHGPYWYRYEKKQGRLRSKYIGKQIPH